jgi:hypothetical protein
MFNRPNQTADSSVSVPALGAPVAPALALGRLAVHSWSVAGRNRLHACLSLALVSLLLPLALLPAAGQSGRQAQLAEEHAEGPQLGLAHLPSPAIMHLAARQPVLLQMVARRTIVGARRPVVGGLWVGCGSL